MGDPLRATGQRRAGRLGMKTDDVLGVETGSDPKEKGLYSACLLRNVERVSNSGE